MIKVLEFTSKPLQAIGNAAALCYDSIDVETIAKKGEAGYSKGIAKHCLSSGHTRTAEFADVTLLISGYSARVMREIYTHVVGTSRTQQSTRYVKYDEDNYKYYTPIAISRDEEALNIYNKAMLNTLESYCKLLDMGIKQQDAANLLPLGQDSTMALKINVRALMHMYSVRTCMRAYEEFRLFMKELSKVLKELDEEWVYIHDNYFKTKCEISKVCNEGECCGRFPKA